MNIKIKKSVVVGFIVLSLFIGVKKVVAFSSNVGRTGPNYVTPTKKLTPTPTKRPTPTPKKVSLFRRLFNWL